MNTKQIIEIVKKVKDIKDRNQRILQIQPLGNHIMNFPHFKKLFKEHPDSYNPLMFMNFLLRLSFHEYKPHKSIWEYNDIVSGIFIILVGEVKIYQPPNKNLLIKEQVNMDDNNIIENISSSINKITRPIRKCITEINNININNNLNDTPKNNNLKRKSQRNAIICSTLFPKYNKENKYYSLTTDNINNKFDIKYSRRSSSNLISFLKEEDYEYLLKRAQYIELKENKKLDYIVTEGNVIGEDCLLKDIRYRNYAAETNTKCIFAFLRKKDYHALFDKINESNKSKLKSFLYSLRYFNNRNNFIDKLYKIINIKNFNKGHYIFRQNDIFKTFYIVRVGSVNLSIIKREKIKSKLDPEVFIKNAYVKKEHFTSEKKYKIKGEYFINRKYNLVNLGVGEIFGDIEYYGGYKKYLYTAKCNEDVELLEIDIEFYKKIQSKDSISFLDKKIKNQIQFLFKRINDKDEIEMKCEEKNFRISNKFLKFILEKNKTNEEESKYINCYVDPFPAKKKRKYKVLYNTKISPPASFDKKQFVNNFNNENKNSSYSNYYGTFITNTKKFIKLLYKKRQNNNENKPLIRYLSTKNHKKITNDIIFKALTPKVKIWERNFLDPTKRRKQNSEDQKDVTKPYIFINNSSPPKKSNFKISSFRMNSSKEKKIFFAEKNNNTDKNNINNNINSDNISKRNSSKKLALSQSKSNKNIIRKKIKNEEESSLENIKMLNNSTIFFDGYRVYVNKGKNMSVKAMRDLKKIEKLKRIKNISNREKIQKIFKMGKYS